MSDSAERLRALEAALGPAVVASVLEGSFAGRDAAVAVLEEMLAVKVAAEGAAAAGDIADVDVRVARMRARGAYAWASEAELRAALEACGGDLDAAEQLLLCLLEERDEASGKPPGRRRRRADDSVLVAAGGRTLSTLRHPHWRPRASYALCASEAPRGPSDDDQTTLSLSPLSSRSVPVPPDLRAIDDVQTLRSLAYQLMRRQRDYARLAAAAGGGAHGRGNSAQAARQVGSRLDAVEERLAQVLCADPHWHELDLHGLRLDKALLVMERRLAQAQAAMEASGQGVCRVRVIVGRGLHSDKQSNRMLPRVRAHLQCRGVRVHTDAHAGTLVVTLKR
ncbi:hypothetical protein CDCA_CDCA20G4819 [Cyanidium caldarium]|uniref:Smr domain-containing protein n=1 Tax=Cyanidium caldarium TaxID=2771 RepID=A0AAV9J2L5_CYACA|nr:hypothetical protein CDCA_CDCA20G4819 [Cyanidium caldarium]